jgi:hypothetical protein
LPVSVDHRRRHVGWIAKWCSAALSGVRAATATGSAVSHDVIGTRAGPSPGVILITTRLHDDGRNGGSGQRGAVVADNDRMYHRIGWIGEPAAKIPSISPSAQIEHVSGSGWVISDGDRHVQSYGDEQIRISILWKGAVRTVGGVENDDKNAALAPERIVEIFWSDLVSRGLSMPATAFPLSDQAWQDLVHSIYYSPVQLTE